MTWVPAELSQGLLVFSREYLSAHSDQVQNIVQSIVDQVAIENGLSNKELAKMRSFKGWDGTSGNEGMDFPKVRSVPTVRPELLTKMADLLIKHAALTQSFDLTPFVDNSFVSATQRH